MTQEKPTALRLLQRNKKKDISPILYVALGFVAGLLCGLLIFFAWFKLQTSPTNIDEHSEPSEEHSAHISKQQTQTTPNAPVFTHNENYEDVEDKDFIQPQENELSGFFQHQAQPKPGADGQHVSPFANEPHAVASAPQTQRPKMVPANNVAPTPVKKELKPNAPKETKAPMTKEAESEVSTPQATLQIHVTQKPFTVNELQ